MRLAQNRHFLGDSWVIRTFFGSDDVETLFAAPLDSGKGEVPSAMNESRWCSMDTWWMEMAMGSSGNAMRYMYSMEAIEPRGGGVGELE